MAVDTTKFVNQDVQTAVQVKAYSQDVTGSMISFPIDTIDSGTDLGICTIVTIKPKSLFFPEEYWLMFPAPAAALGQSGNITGPFAVLYDPNNFSVNNTIVNDQQDSAGLTDITSGIFSSISTLIWVLIIIAIVLVVLFVYSNFIKK